MLLKILFLNKLKYDLIELYQKCHQMSTFICDLVRKKSFACVTIGLHPKTKLLLY